MRNRRATVIVAMLVALVGAPRAFQEFGDLWASVQQKTQAKFLGLALNSQVRDQSEVEAANATRAEYLALNTEGEEPAEQAFAAIRASAPAASLKAQTLAGPDLQPLEAEEEVVPEFEAELAHDRVTDADLDSLTHSRSLSAPVAHATANCVAAKEPAPAALAPVAMPLYLSREQTVEVMALQRAAEQTPTFVFEKGPELPAKIRKAIEDAKVVKQKVRFVMMRNAPLPPPPPAS